MLEMIMKPKRAERKPWEMFFIGLIYSALALFLVSFVFSGDTTLSKYSGILLVMFTVIACLPFMYYIIKLEEGKDLEIDDQGRLVKEHWKALSALMWLFFGFIVGFSIGYILLPGQSANNFNAQIEVFCSINSPQNYESCLKDNGIITGNAANNTGMVLGIFANNVSVLIFVLAFSLALGAGAIFILVWNASVIAAAIGMFAKGGLTELPLGILRYMIHGLPEIAAYFIAALGGGIVSVAIIRKDMDSERKWNILQDAIVLVVIALLILLVSAVIEVYFTPTIMGFF
ncbi:MAG: stage II sporulation protein M [archaeon]